MILALHSLLKVEEKFPNFLASLHYPQVFQEPQLLQGHLQPRQHRALVARLHMASLAKEMYRMDQAPVFRCRGMYLGQPKIGLMRLEGLGMYEGLFYFSFFFSLCFSLRFLFLFPSSFCNSFSFFQIRDAAAAPLWVIDLFKHLCCLAYSFHFCELEFFP